MSDRWGVFVNGEKWYEFDDRKTAEDYMDILAFRVTEDDPTASFDVTPLPARPPEERTR